MTDEKSGFYFNNDINMSAAAMIEMFGKEAPQKAKERAEDYEESKSKDFWIAISDRATKLLRVNPNKGT